MHILNDCSIGHKRVEYLSVEEAKKFSDEVISLKKYDYDSELSSYQKKLFVPPMPEWVKKGVPTPGLISLGKTSWDTKESKQAKEY